MDKCLFPVPNRCSPCSTRHGPPASVFPQAVDVLVLGLEHSDASLQSFDLPIQALILLSQTIDPTPQGLLVLLKCCDPFVLARNRIVQLLTSSSS